MGFVTLRLEMVLSLSPANKTLKYRGRVKKINKYIKFRKDLFLPSFSQNGWKTKWRTPLKAKRQPCEPRCAKASPLPSNREPLLPPGVAWMATRGRAPGPGDVPESRQHGGQGLKEQCGAVNCRFVPSPLRK